MKTGRGFGPVSTGVLIMTGSPLPPEVEPIIVCWALPTVTEVSEGVEISTGSNSIVIVITYDDV